MSVESFLRSWIQRKEKDNVILQKLEKEGDGEIWMIFRLMREFCQRNFCMRVFDESWDF